MFGVGPGLVLRARGRRRRRRCRCSPACAAASAPVRPRASRSACAAGLRRCTCSQPRKRWTIRPRASIRNDVRNAREDAVGRPDLPVEIEQDWKEVEAVLAQLRPHRLRASRDLDPDQLRALVRRQRGQVLLQEAEQRRGSAGRCGGRRPGPTACRAGRPGRSSPWRRGPAPRRSAPAADRRRRARRRRPARAAAAPRESAPRSRSRRRARRWRTGPGRRSRSPRHRRRGSPPALAGPASGRSAAFESSRIGKSKPLRLANSVARARFDPVAIPAIWKLCLPRSGAIAWIVCATTAASFTSGLKKKSSRRCPSSLATSKR